MPLRSETVVAQVREELMGEGRQTLSATIAIWTPAFLLALMKSGILDHYDYGFWIKALICGDPPSYDGLPMFPILILIVPQITLNETLAGELPFGQIQYINFTIRVLRLLGRVLDCWSPAGIGTYPP